MGRDRAFGERDDSQDKGRDRAFCESKNKSEMVGLGLRSMSRRLISCPFKTGLPAYYLLSESNNPLLKKVSTLSCKIGITGY